MPEGFHHKVIKTHSSLIDFTTDSLIHAASVNARADKTQIEKTTGKDSREKLFTS